MWCLFFSPEIFAQNETKSLPIQFGQYMRSYSLLNPASAGSQARAEINTGVQRNGGNWSNIGTYFFNANIRLTPDKITVPLSEINENEEEEEEETITDTTAYTDDYTIETTQEGPPLPNNFHVGGLSLIGDQEGAFLNRTGVYALYAWHTRISPTVFLSAGVSAGVKNYSVDDSYVYGGGSSFAPDGNIGLYLYTSKYNLGISANQIFNSKLTPLREASRLVPHLNVQTSRVFELNRFLLLKPSLLVRVAPDFPVDLNGYVGALIQNVLSATVGYKFQRGMIAMVGFEKIRLGDHYLKAAFSYYLPVGNNNQLNINTYEVTLNYFLKPHSRTYGSIF